MNTRRNTLSPILSILFFVLSASLVPISAATKCDSLAKALAKLGAFSGYPVDPKIDASIIEVFDRKPWSRLSPVNTEKNFYANLVWSIDLDQAAEMHPKNNPLRKSVILTFENSSAKKQQRNGKVDWVLIQRNKKLYALDVSSLLDFASPYMGAVRLLWKPQGPDMELTVISRPNGVNYRNTMEVRIVDGKNHQPLKPWGVTVDGTWDLRVQNRSGTD